MVIEDSDLGVVCGHESVELLLVVVPLDGVEMVSLQVVVAAEDRLLTLERVRRDHRVFRRRTEEECNAGLDVFKMAGFVY